MGTKIFTSTAAAEVNASSKRKRKTRSQRKAKSPSPAKSTKAKAVSPAGTQTKLLTPPRSQRLLPSLPVPFQRGEAPVLAQAAKVAGKDPLPAPSSSLPLSPESATARTPYLQPHEAADPRLPLSLLGGTIAAVVGVIMLVRFWSHQPWVNSEQMIARAKEALRQQNLPAALGAIQKVKEGSRQDPAFLRVLADYFEQTRSSPQALADTLEKLQSTGDFRSDDQLWLCRAWLATNRLDKARSAWEAIPPPLSEGLEAARLKVELLRQEGQFREAAQLQADLNTDFADDPLVAVRLAVAQINGPFPEVRQKAQVRLWELARRRDHAGLEALRMLGHQSDRTGSETADLLGLVSRHPLASPADRQGITSLLMRLAPARRAELLQTETDRCKDQDPAALALWLAREGETERLLQVSPELRRMQPTAWFQTVARALAESKQWQGLLDLVQKEQARPGPISPAELLRWRAVAQMQLHPQNVAAPYDDLQLSIRQGAVEKNFPSVALSAQIAEDWHMFDLALEAGLVLARPGAPDEVHMLENSRRIATLLKDSEALADIASRLTGLHPENVLYARHAAYLRLLRGENIETTVMAEDTTSKKSAAALLAIALKAWRLKDQALTAQTLLHLHDTTSLTTGERAVYAGLLATATACGQVSHAFQIAEKIRPELLLPEELAFLKMAL